MFMLAFTLSWKMISHLVLMVGETCGNDEFESNKWSLHLLNNLSSCLICATWKVSGVLTRFEPMSSVVQCSHQGSYETTQIAAGRFVGFMCCMSCPARVRINLSNTWAQQFDLMRSEWLHSWVGKSNELVLPRSWVWIVFKTLDHFQVQIWHNCLNCPASAKVISSSHL